MNANDLAQKALTVFNPQIEEPPTIDLPIYLNNVLLCTIRFRHDGKQWIGNTSDWEMKDIVDCFENPQKYGIKKQDKCPPASWWKGDPTCGGLTENYGLGKAQEK